MPDKQVTELVQDPAIGSDKVDPVETASERSYYVELEVLMSQISIHNAKRHFTVTDHGYVSISTSTAQELCT